MSTKLWLRKAVGPSVAADLAHAFYHAWVEQSCGDLDLAVKFAGYAGESQNQRGYRPPETGTFKPLGLPEQTFHFPGTTPEYLWAKTAGAKGNRRFLFSKGKNAAHYHRVGLVGVSALAYLVRLEHDAPAHMVADKLLEELPFGEELVTQKQVLKLLESGRLYFAVPPARTV